MKNVFLAIGLIVFFQSLFAQKVFEGKIILQMITENNTQAGIVEIFYGKQKIKSVTKTNTTAINNNDDVILDFSKGKVYNINAVKKTYTEDNFKYVLPFNFSDHFENTGKSKSILNTPCTAFSPIDTSKENIDRITTVTLWYADSLIFAVNEKYKNADELTKFTNGSNIIMGMSICLNTKEYQKIFELNPIAIEPLNIADAMFEIPADYELKPVDSGKIKPSNNINLKQIYKVEMKVEKVEIPPPPPPPPLIPPPFPKTKPGKKQIKKT